MKPLKALVAIALLAGSLTACTDDDADVVSENLSTAADNFEIQRRIVFYNGISGEYILEVEGLCSIGNNDSAGKLSVTCKTGSEQYKKHYLGLSDNVTFFAEQIESTYADAYHYRVTFKPEVIVPDVDLRTSNDSEDPS